MIDFAIYGKIILDSIRLLDGRVVRRVLGGGGPQAAFGARVWHDSVGLLSRVGDDFPAGNQAELEAVGADLQGVVRLAGIPTPHGGLQYNDSEYRADDPQLGLDLAGLTLAIEKLVVHPIGLPADYQKPLCIHLITEFADEPMVQNALALQAAGSIFSLEPLIWSDDWRNREEMLALVRQADTVTPDWPAASGIAGSDDPLTVMRYWSTLGPALVAVRHGSHGSYVWDREHDEMWCLPPVPVAAVDPTGAGNAYGGGLCVGWALGREARLAGAYAAISAMFVVRTPGTPSWRPELRAEAVEGLERALEAAYRL